jgi:hypothetical protein
MILLGKCSTNEIKRCYGKRGPIDHVVIHVGKISLPVSSNCVDTVRYLDDPHVVEATTKEA